MGVSKIRRRYYIRGSASELKPLKRSKLISNEMRMLFMLSASYKTNWDMMPLAVHWGTRFLYLISNFSHRYIYSMCTQSGVETNVVPFYSL